MIGIWPDVRADGDRRGHRGRRVHRREQHARHHRGHEHRAGRAAGGVGHLRFRPVHRRRPRARTSRARLVEHYNAHVPFLIGAGTVVLAGARPHHRAHGALDAADRDESAARECGSRGRRGRTRGGSGAPGGGRHRRGGPRGGPAGWADRAARVELVQARASRVRDGVVPGRLPGRRFGRIRS